jgi:hypothetical protein
MSHSITAQNQNNQKAKKQPSKTSKNLKINLNNTRTLKKKKLVLYSLPGCRVMISSEELSRPSRTDMHFEPVTTYTALTNKVSPGGSASGLCSPSPEGRGRRGETMGERSCFREGERGGRCDRQCNTGRWRRGLGKRGSRCTRKEVE